MLIVAPVNPDLLNIAGALGHHALETRYSPNSAIFNSLAVLQLLIMFMIGHMWSITHIAGLL